MRRFLLPALLIALCTTPSSAQEWSRAYGGPGSEVGKFIEPTRDGGFYVAGTQSLVQQGPERFYVSRFDSNGMQLWEKSYGKPGLTHTLFAFSTTSDGGYMLGGFTGVQFSGTESALMYRADSTGAVVFENDVDYDDSDHWHVLLERPEGGYYMGGHTDSKGDSRGDMWLQKLDEDRRLIWEKVYDRNTAEHSHSGTITRDGGVILLGHTDQGGYEKYWVVKVDSAGVIEWQKVYGSGAAYHDSPYKVLETDDGNFAFFGGSYSPNQGTGTAWLLVIDPVGNILVDQHYGNTSAESFTWAGRQTSDGGYVLAGYTTYRTRGQTDMYIVKTDASGAVEWEEKYGGTGYDYGFDVIEVASGYVSAGFTGSPSIMTGGGGDLYIVKTARRLAAPGAVALVAPAAGASVPSSGATLVWDAAEPEVDRYWLDIGSSADFTSRSTDTTLTTTSTTIAGLEPGRTYWWRVKAHNSAGWGAFSEARSFVVSSASAVQTERSAGAIGLSAIPNPARDVLTLRYEMPRAARTSVALYDGLGRAVTVVSEADRGVGHQVERIDLTGVAPGVYTVRVESEGGVAAIARVSVVR
ncbi:MAG TPA: T9SS type A sorting domain-containing protein [Candidatus Kapabacteria bacterium]|jgi:hypothetical protein|nr:T9SS type A sorting domain-containing protein [Candidatus Kapabacteria bacterium]